MEEFASNEHVQPSLPSPPPPPLLFPTPALPAKRARARLPPLRTGARHVEDVELEVALLKPLLREPHRRHDVVRHHLRASTGGCQVTWCTAWRAAEPAHSAQRAARRAHLLGLQVVDDRRLAAGVQSDDDDLALSLAPTERLYMTSSDRTREQGPRGTSRPTAERPQRLTSASRLKKSMSPGGMRQLVQQCTSKRRT